jgi:hypothetical protein
MKLLCECDLKFYVNQSYNVGGMDKSKTRYKSSSKILYIGREEPNYCNRNDNPFKEARKSNIFWRS